MSRVITFSRVFPAYHPKAGEPTYFVEKICRSILAWTTEGKAICDLNVWAEGWEKHHTIRAGNRWNAGDWFSPRVWSGKPDNSKQIIIAPDIQVKKVWDIKIEGYFIWINKELFSSNYNGVGDREIAFNDGLSPKDFWDWFPTKPGKIFQGQIICWNEHINYPL